MDGFFFFIVKERRDFLMRRDLINPFSLKNCGRMKSMNCHILEPTPDLPPSAYQWNKINIYSKIVYYFFYYSVAICLAMLSIFQIVSYFFIIIIIISFFWIAQEFRMVDNTGNACQTFHGITSNIDCSRTLNYKIPFMAVMYGVAFSAIYGTYHHWRSEYVVF